ncbi:MAG: hypothetical protein WC271_11085 [Bacteroidales bacterium]|jgi:hypothetical protein|nr:hypothetical protein [Bacteroidales bacterium]MDD3132955.1 hypothetical protein [Bacteroidales bacterium]MDD3526244.1 hypothetical protein [Bacteroidales bacterium]NCU36845.1 hypothetical protein [Candidatus Falkowbacteria bacterium]NLO51208.1 hypothetical protein [Bacteroidales bacterium]
MYDFGKMNDDKWIFYLGGNTGFPLYPSCAGGIFVSGTCSANAESARQQKYPPPLRRDAAPIPAARRDVSFAGGSIRRNNYF